MIRVGAEWTDNRELEGDTAGDDKVDAAFAAVVAAGGRWGGGYFEARFGEPVVEAATVAVMCNVPTAVTDVEVAKDKRETLGEAAQVVLESVEFIGGAGRGEVGADNDCVEGENTDKLELGMEKRR